MFDLTSENGQMCKQAYLISYNAAGFFMAFYLLIQLAPEAFGFTDPLVSSYAKKNSQVRTIYQVSELLVIFEMLNALIGIQNMKRHIFIFSVWSLFVVFCVIPLYNTHDWIIYWVFVRSVRKLLRHLHRMYLDLGFRHEVFPLEALCINGLCFTLPIEYIVSVIIILVTFPVAHQSRSMQIPICSHFNIDLSLSYLIGLFLSLPHFLSSLVYICRKREH